MEVKSRPHVSKFNDKYVLNKLVVHGSVHHNINRIEITNKMRPCSKSYYSNVS